MRYRLLVLAAALASGLHAQSIGWGVKAGVPFTDFFDASTSGNLRYSQFTRRYTIGPMVDLRLPLGLGIEANALYKRFRYERTSATGEGGAKGNFWEFPLLLKYRMPGILARPYVAGGFSFRTIQGLAGFGADLLPGGDPPELRDNSTRGVVLGTGLEVRLPKIRVAPEVRYTRWGSRAFEDVRGAFESRRNQLEFLVGLTF
ncbi:MAG: outer membrane beta-barrel protein [Bryobacteraceae bacterium]|nr:outer membrane beta-barrel protein [Bryobacteraceae bacterium]